MEAKVVYFEQPGEEHTDETLRLALEWARAHDVKKMVVASTRGNVARTAAERVAGTGIQLIVVPIQYGYFEVNRFPRDLVSALEAQGHKVHFATMPFHTEDLYGSNAPKAMANLLRIFGQGTKVCVEIALMAADAGLVGMGERVITVAGTGRGADTALVITGATTHNLRDMRVNEIICRPI